MIIGYALDKYFKRRKKMKNKRILFVLLTFVALLVMCVFASCGNGNKNPGTDPGCSHKFDGGKVTVEPTCDKEGIKEFTCSKCQEIKKEPVPAIGHDLGEWTVYKEATPYEEGEERSKCKRCTYYKSRPIEKLESGEYVAVDDGCGNVTYIKAEDDGSYTLADPLRVGYNFLGWKDAEGNSFPSSGTIKGDVSVKAEWELDGTDTLSELIERAAAGVDQIKITANISITEPIFFVGNIKIYSDGDFVLKRSPEYAGDFFVIGQNKDGVGSPLLFIDTIVTIGGGKGQLILDGNKDGTTVDVAGSLLFVTDSSIVNIHDGVVIANNKKTLNDRITSCGGFINETTMEKAGGAAILLVNGTVNMYGGIIENNEVITEYTSSTNEDGTEALLEVTACGGAIYNRGNFNMYGGIIRGNEALRGGAIYNDEIVNLVSGTISGNKAHTYGGAVSSSSSAEAQMFIGSEGESDDKMLFEENISLKAGGGLYSNTNSPIVIYGNVTFKNNVAEESSGGAIYTGGSLTIRNTEFIGNSCRYSGGAIYHHYANADRDRRDLELTDCTFKGNEASLGGAVVLSAADAEFNGGTKAVITNCLFAENKAAFSEFGAGNGGAVYVTRSSDAYITGSRFENNVASTNAGALAIHSEANVRIKESSFSGNQASYGGALYTSSKSEVSIIGASFEGNKAVCDAEGKGGNGGAIHTRDVSIIIKNTTLDGNSAENNGGGIYQVAISLKLEADVSFKNNAAAVHGGAIYISYATQEDGTKKGAVLEINGTSFEKNTALSGGAISARSESKLTVVGSSFVGNSTPGAEVGSEFGGGAIYANNSTLRFTDTAFDGNLSGYYGGVFRLDACVTTLSGVEMQNSTGGTGGVIYAGGGELKVEDVSLKNNVSALNGAIYVTRNTLEINRLTAEGNSGVNGGVLCVSKSAVATITASEFKGNSGTNGGVIFTEGGFVTIGEGNKFIENTAKKGGAIDAINGATVSVVGSSFEKNEASSNGGALYVEGANLTVVANTVFDGNLSQSMGGAIYVASHFYTPEVTDNAADGAVAGGDQVEVEKIEVKATVSVTGAVFKNGSALRGGAVYVVGNEYSLTDCEFIKNCALDAEYGGGAIYNTQATGTLKNVSFTENKSHKGGAIALHSTSAMTVESITAKANAAETNDEEKFGIGGVFYLNNSTLKVKAGNGGKSVLGGKTEEANSATSGGAIYADNGAQIVVIGAEFTGNTSTNNGGAIYAHGGSRIELENVKMAENASANNGGAIYSNASEIIVKGENSSFEKNTATGHGGAIYLTYTTVEEEKKGATLKVNGGSFSENSALSGGAISGRTNSVIEIYGATFNANATEKAVAQQGQGGGAIYVNNSALTLDKVTLSNNISGYYGGAVRSDEATVTIKGGSTLSGNVGVTGAAIYASSASSIIAEDVTVSNNNDEKITNGVIYINGGTSSFKNVNASGNKAQSGGVFYFTAANVGFESLNASENNAKQGGVIYARLSEVKIEASVFEKNSVEANGGAISVVGTVLNALGENSFKENLAAGHAGAIYVTYHEEKSADGAQTELHKGVLNMVGGSFEANAAMGGGAVSVRSSCEAIFDGTAFTNNSSIGFANENDGDGEGGGAIYAGYGKLTLSGVTMSGNTATEGFGGAINALKSNVSINGGSFTENSATFGGAMVVNGKNITVGGDISVKDNENGNIFLSDGALIVVDKALGENASIGVTLEDDAQVFAKGDGVNITTLDAYKDNFFSDKGDIIYLTEKGSLAIGLMIIEQPDAFNKYTVTVAGDAEYTWYIWNNGTLGDVVVGADGATLTGAVDGLTYVCVVSFNGKDITTEPTLYMSEKTHPVCGESCECSGETHENITWTPIVGLDEFKRAMGIDGNYYLAFDIAVDKTVSVKADVNLCLNGKKLTRTGDGDFSILNVTVGNTLTLTDCGEEERVGYIDPVSGLWCEGVYGGEGIAAEYSVYGGVITGGKTSHGGAIYAKGNIVLYGVSFAGNCATTNGGAIYLNGGVLTAKGDNLFVGNTSAGHAGAIYVTYVKDVSDGVLDMTGGVFAYNKAIGGGAVSVRSNCEATFTDTEFIGNAVAGDDGTADGNAEGGGAIYVGFASLTLNNVTMTDNASDVFGGAVNAVDSTVTVSGGEFKNNTAVRGGAVNLIIGCNASFTSTKFTSNSATGVENAEGGGAINSENGILTLSTVTMSGNSSANYGGAINARKGTVEIKDNTVITGSVGTTGAALYFREARTKVTITDTTVSDTKATSNGAIYMTSASELTVTRLTAIGNTANQGGVFYFSGGATVTLNGIVAKGNSTKGSGGVVFVSQANLTVNASDLGGSESGDGNSAGSHGGAIYVSSESTLNVTDTVFESNIAGNHGGAIYAVACNVTISGEDTLFKNNSATQHGGAIYLSYATVKVNENGEEVDKTVGTTLTMTDGRFEGNVAFAGGAISARSYCVVGLTGTELVGNSSTAQSADGFGGGALYTNTNTVALTGVTMDGNSSAYYGGALMAVECALTITDCVVVNNTGVTGVAIDLRGAASSTATITGLTLTNNQGNGSGVIYVTNNVTLNVSNLTASGNKANNGGVFYASGAAIITIEDSQLSTNTATTSGGAIDHRSSGKLTVKNTTFTSNESGEFGGAITANGAGQVEIIDSTFTENKTTATKTDTSVSKICRGGGAIFVSSKATVSISGSCSFTANSAAGTKDVTTAGSEMTDAGGAIMVDGGKLTVNGASFSKNTASNGGAIGTSRSAATAMNIKNCSFIENLSTNNGAAIYIQNGVKNETDSIFIDGCSFKDNTATVKTGSSVYIRTNSSATITNVTSSGGTNKYGKAFYVTGGARVTLGGTVNVSDGFYITGSGTTAIVNYLNETEKTAWEGIITTASEAQVSYVDASGNS